MTSQLPVADADGKPGPSATVVLPGARVLVTGASGYVGGRLVTELLAAGYRVRCLVRSAAKVDGAPWRSQVEVVTGDIEGDLETALADVEAVYYLVHSIGATPDWQEREQHGAANLRDGAAAAGVTRIVYLGGLGGEPADDTDRPDDADQPDDTDRPELSAHLRSRHDVGRILADGPVPVTELRAAVVIGSGSASFEMLRYLVEVLPVMVTPRWVDTRCQPIAVRDVLRYLQQVLGQADTAGRVLEIGGTDVITYREMMRIYAEEAGLRARLIIPVPVLSPHLSSLWVGLVTPLPRSLARPLVDSLVNEVVVHDHLVEQLCPGPRASFREAVRSALGRVRAGTVVTSWSVAEPSWREHAAPRPTDPDWSGGSVFLDERTATVAAPAQAVYDAVSRVGGERGWYSGRWLWGVRGALDKLVGGPGMRRARRQPDRLSVGDPLDFWRVDALEPGRLVRLRAEMRLPGEAWLEWRIESGEAPDRESRLHQIATFVPRGLWGRLYWYGALPFHRFVFPGLLHGLAEAAEAEAGE